jgi:hypothetical protein
MARLFYHRPKFAILDECTSAVSDDVESTIYLTCKLLGITIFTVSHRPSLAKFHDVVLRFEGEGRWSTIQIDSKAELEKDRQMKAQLASRPSQIQLAAANSSRSSAISSHSAANVPRSVNIMSDSARSVGSTAPASTQGAAGANAPSASNPRQHQPTAAEAVSDPSTAPSLKAAASSASADQSQTHAPTIPAAVADGSAEASAATARTNGTHGGQPQSHAGGRRRGRHSKQ